MKNIQPQNIPDIRKKVKASLRYSVLDGTFFSAMVGFAESYFSALAVYFKATSIELSLIVTLPQLLGALSQILSNKFISLFQSRKKFVCVGVFLQAFILLPIIFIFFIPKLQAEILILLVILYWVLGTIIHPAWYSWIGDLVPPRIRGVYFGKRNRLMGAVSFLTFIIAGFILYFTSQNSAEKFIGFTIIFLLAIIARFISLYFLTKKYEPEYSFPANSQEEFLEIINKPVYKNFNFFVFFVGLMNFGVFISSPFFTPYLLVDLKFNYLLYSIIVGSAIFIKFNSMYLWGILADKYGTKTILSFTGYFMSIIPLLWIFSHQIWYLILIQIYSGFIWAGFEIATFNFVLDISNRTNRAKSIAYYNIVNGFSMFFGAICGALVINFVHVSFSKYYLVFALSFLLRYIDCLIFIPKIHEVRPVKNISNQELLLKIFSYMPLSNMFIDLFERSIHPRRT
jgi:MFS family permease